MVGVCNQSIGAGRHAKSWHRSLGAKIQEIPAF
jgi:hypothetical protein